MRRLIGGRLARALASILIAVFAGPTLFGWSLALPAVAQITAQTQLELVAVVPFTNLTKVQPGVLGDKAAGAVHQALLDTQMFDVRSLEETRQKMADLGIHAPLDEIALTRLGEALGVGVNGVVFGEIRAAGFRRISRSTQAEITLMVAIFDLPTHSIRTGSLVTGHSSIVAGEYDPDALIDQALNQAVYQAVKEIQSHRPITGIVQWAHGNDVMINIGDPEGVREDMQFVVLHNGARTGILQVTRVQRRYSDARLLEGNVRTLDQIREIVTIPALGATLPIPGAKAAKKRNLSKLLLIAVAGIALLSFAGGSKTGSASSVTAAAISNVVETGITKTQEFFSVINLSNQSGAAVQLRWRGAGGGQRLAGYEIWRDGELFWFVSAQGGGGTVATFPTPISALEVTINIEADTGEIDVNAVLSGPSSGDGIPPQAIQDGEGTNQMTYTLRGDYYNDTELEATLYIGPETGSRHTFSLRTVVGQLTGPSDSRAWIIRRAGSLGKAQVVTFTAPPVLQVPAQNEAITDPTAVTFAFNPRNNSFGFTSPFTGADDYILQLSTDSGFSTSATVNDNLTAVDGVHTSDELITVTKDLTALLGPLPTPSVVFWRIGARLRADHTKPSPYPFGNLPSDAYHYVFSDSRQIVITGGP